MAACSDAGTSGPQRTFALSNGTAVEVAANGGVARCRVTVARSSTSDAAGIVARHFTEAFRGPTAIWIFERKGREAFAIDRLVAARQGRRLGRRRGGFASGTGRARMTVAPGADAAATTRVRAEVDGIDGVKSIALPVRCDAESSFTPSAAVPPRIGPRARRSGCS